MKFKNYQELINYCYENNLDTPEEFDFNEEAEWIEEEVINPENSQYLIRKLIPADEKQYEEAKIQLALTTRYHSWSDTIADKLMREIEDNEINPATIRKYNQYVEDVNLYIPAESLLKEDIKDYKKMKKIINNNSKMILKWTDSQYLLGIPIVIE